jgi:Ca-activated chloride channel family protein
MRDKALFVSIGVVAGLLFAMHHAVARPSVELDVRLGNPVLLAGQKSTVYLKVGLHGQEVGANARRPPVNICLAIDRSGSMSGEKLTRARDGAIAALRRLSPEDTVAVVAYDDTVDVLVPASPASQRRGIEEGIAALQPGGGTALYAGVVKCAQQVRSRFAPERVNRIILLSDGQANVGPSSPGELGALGAELMAQGISVSTVGLGLDYNEDLMTELALRSDGRHTFVEHAGDLTAFLDGELTAVTSIVASEVDVHVRCRGEARPVRVLGRPATIVGQTAHAIFGKVYGGREHFFVVELEVPAAGPGGERPLVDVELSYRDLVNGRMVTRTAAASARVSASAKDVATHIDNSTMGVVEMAVADLASERALALRDQGHVEEARAVLRENAERLEEKMQVYQDKRLEQMQQRQSSGAKSMSKAPEEWNHLRKAMKKEISDNPLDGL